MPGASFSGAASSSTSRRPPGVTKPLPQSHCRAVTESSRRAHLGARFPAAARQPLSRAIRRGTVPSILPRRSVMSPRTAAATRAGTAATRFARSGSIRAPPTERPARNCLMLRAAWRSRWRFSTSAMRTIILAVLAEPDARRDRDIGVLEQQLREGEAADVAEAPAAPAPRRTWWRPAPARPSRPGAARRSARRAAPCSARGSRRCSPAGR